MDRLSFAINGYKCLNGHSFDLPALTVLTGANGAGKSSVMQSLLIMRRAIELGVQTKDVSVDLSDDKYAFDYGDTDDVLYTDGDGTLSFKLGDISIASLEVEENSKMLPLKCNAKGDSFVWENESFLYLDAERIGPRYDFQRFDVKGYDCGCHGQYTAEVVSQSSFTIIPSTRYLIPSREGNFQIQLDNWVDYIFPGLAIRTIPSGSSSFRLIVRNNKNLRGVGAFAPNIGFGITYALPIIVEGLLIPQGGWLLVENPEAHLHAKAQSNMGYFLAKMAASGVRVIVETHSEHIVNGMRRALVDKIGLSSEDVDLYYLDWDMDGKIFNQRITIDASGNLSDSPVDFFDQSRQDLLYIIQKSMGQ